jgi:hypothetical protein
MSAAWRVDDPVNLLVGADAVLMDAENLIMMAGPGCFKCEQPYSRRLARRPCRGESS